VQVDGAVSRTSPAVQAVGEYGWHRVTIAPSAMVFLFALAAPMAMPLPREDETMISTSAQTRDSHGTGAAWWSHVETLGGPRGLRGSQ
jgi:hypothetical protein